MFYTIISLITLALSIKLFSKVTGSLELTKLNFVSWIFYVQLIGMSFFASILVINGWENHYELVGIREDTRLFGWLSLQYTLIAMPLGMLLINYLFGVKNIKGLFHSYLDKPVRFSFSDKDKTLKVLLIMLSLLSIGSIVYCFRIMGNIPILSIISKTANELALLRAESNQSFLGDFRIKKWLAQNLTVILSCIAFCYWKLTRKYADLLWFCMMFFSSALALTMNLEKSPLATYLLIFALLSVLIDGSLSRKKIIIVLSLSVILIITSYALIAKSFDHNTAIVILNRIFLSQAVGTYLAFEYYPSRLDFSYFNTFSNLIVEATNSKPAQSVAREIIMEKHPESQTAGVMNSLFIQGAWGSFGLIGILLAPFLVGAHVQLFNLVFLMTRKTPVTISLATFFGLNMPITGEFNYFIYPKPLIVASFVFVITYLLAYMLLELGKLNKFSTN